MSPVEKILLALTPEMAANVRALVAGGEMNDAGIAFKENLHSVPICRTPIDGNCIAL
ncbi:MAG: hypothetical protein FD163_2484 [Hyphomonadaceae bacterium]|nr:MAG: hypothetical protein FD128_1872 [Hyphomonadaceae bacterium]KAF0182694.1 MAG: hypothetical protein FD163_2484 [Hyphomonadaceae bacterium]